MLTNGKYTIWGERIRKPQGLIEHERDQRIFPPYYCSMKFLRVFPEFLEVYRQDYDFFFFNVSFAGKRYYAPYPSQKAFFKELRYKLDCDYLSGIPHKLSLIYLIPDYGMRNPFKSGGAPPILNFTGFLLFQKSVRQSFNENCVQSETIAFFGSEFDSIKSIELVDELIGPQGVWLPSEVAVAGHALFELETDEHYNAATTYCADIFRRNWYEEDNEIFEVSLQSPPKFWFKTDWSYFEEDDDEPPEPSMFG